MSVHTELEVETEFSRPLEVAELENGEVVREIEANATELAGLQRRFAVDMLSSATAKLTITPEPQGVVQVRGVVCAKLNQTCIVSLEPVDEEVEETVSVIYLPPGVEEPRDTDLEAAEDYEPFDGLTIDLGELTAQQIAAAINPYPRKAGVEFGNQGQLGDNGPEERDNPFAVLEQLKGKEGPAQEH